VVEAAPDLELVHPLGVGGGEVPPEGSQRDPLADDDEIRLVAIHPGIVSSPRASAAVGDRGRTFRAADLGISHLEVTDLASREASALPSSASDGSSRITGNLRAVLVSYSRKSGQ